MSTIFDIAQQAENRFNIDFDTAEKMARSYLRQASKIDAVPYNEDDLGPETTAFLLGAIHAGLDTSDTDQKLAAIRERAEDMNQAAENLHHAKNLRDRAIFEASEAGCRHAELMSAAGLKKSAIIDILAKQRAK